LLPTHAVDALLVSGPENRRYLSGFTADDPDWGVLLIKPEAALLVTDFRYQVWAQQEVPDFEVFIYKVDLGETLGKLLQDLQVHRLGFEAAHLTYRQHQRLTKAVADAGLEVAWEPLEGLVEGLRQIKTGAELAVMRRALALTETVMRQVAGELTPGQTERQVAWEIESASGKAGPRAWPFLPLWRPDPTAPGPIITPGTMPSRTGSPSSSTWGPKSTATAVI
jgi:Xaa-Pro aminopeptidase